MPESGLWLGDLLAAERLRLSFVTTFTAPTLQYYWLNDLIKCETCQTAFNSWTFNPLAFPKGKKPAEFLREKFPKEFFNEGLCNYEPINCTNELVSQSYITAKLHNCIRLVPLTPGKVGKFHPLPDPIRCGIRFILPARALRKKITKCVYYSTNRVKLYPLTLSLLSIRYNICLWPNGDRKNIYHGRYSPAVYLLHVFLF